MATCADSLGRNEQKLEHLFRALTIDSSRAEAFVRLGFHHYNQHEWSQAVPYFTAATVLPRPIDGFIEDAAYTWAPWDFLSVCHSELGMYDKALEETLQALRWSDDRPRLFKNMEFYLNQLGATGAADDHLRRDAARYPRGKRRIDRDRLLQVGMSLEHVRILPNEQQPKIEVHGSVIGVQGQQLVVERDSALRIGGGLDGREVVHRGLEVRVQRQCLVVLRSRLHRVLLQLLVDGAQVVIRNRIGRVFCDGCVEVADRFLYRPAGLGGRGPG